jgi:hypothetical protein
MSHASSYTQTHTRTPTPTHPCSRTCARAPAGHVRSQARPHLCPSTLCPRTRSTTAHPRTRWRAVSVGVGPYLSRSGPLSRPALGCLLRPVHACRWAAFRKRSALPAIGVPPSTASTVRGLPTIRYGPPWWGSRSRSAVPGPPGARFALAWAGRPPKLDSAPPPAAVCPVCGLCSRS